jgi:Zn-dependent peptidase ImmA (M78 family)/transcriptional regulator with XRE-family HTH domain
MRTEDINPQVLRWARETAGLSVEQAAGKLGLKDTAKMTAAAKLEAAEGGARPVGEGFLKRAAALYSRPLLAFYLAAPPAMGERGADYRSAPTRAGAGQRGEAVLDALVRDVRARQQMLREILVDVDGAGALPFVASAGVASGAASVAARIRAALGTTVEDQRAARNAESLFRVLRDASGAIGIYVLLLGDLGSHHSDIGEDLFRGLAIADDVAPMVVVNDNDAPTARSFTLIHELAHLWIGVSGISGPLEAVPAAEVERFCNAVASEFLLPGESVSGFSRAAGNDVGACLAEADRIGVAWNVSPAAVIYKAALLQLIEPAAAGGAFAALATRWRARRAQDRAARDPAEGGPSYYVSRRFSLGNALLDVVRRALQEDVVTHTKAAKILGVSAASVDGLLWDRPRAA